MTRNASQAVPVIESLEARILLCGDTPWPEPGEDDPPFIQDGGGSAPVPAAPLPSSFSLVPDYVTPVKDQGTGYTCWAFAALGSLESTILKAGGPEEDFSENNLQHWHGFTSPHGGSTLGGTPQIAEAYLGRGAGPVNETDDPYPTAKPETNPDCPPAYYVGEMLRLSGAEQIKAVLMDTGAVISGMYFGATEQERAHFFDDETDTYYYHYHLSNPDYAWERPVMNRPNHGITIVGWDDSMETGAATDGAWLVKNSWGTDWGDSGYFWWSYADPYGANGEKPECFAGAIPAGPYDQPYFWDEFGSVDVGPWSQAFNAFEASSDQNLEAAGFYTQAPGADYTVSVYDTFSGGQLSNLLATESGTAGYAGWHTVEFETPVALTQGNDFYVCVQITDHGGLNPMAFDAKRSTNSATALPGQSYYFDGVAWVDLQDYEFNPASSYDGTANFCIKALATNECPPGATIAPVDPDLRSAPVSDMSITFDEAVEDFDLSDLVLTRDGASIDLQNASITMAPNHRDFTLSGLSSLTAKAGQYTLTLAASGSDVTDRAGNALAADAAESWAMNTIFGTTGDDTLTLKNSNGLLEVTVNQDAAYTLDPENLALLYIKGLAGNDTLTLDLTDGTPDLPTGGVDFDAGESGVDILAIVGSSGADTATLSATQATVNNRTITYSNVEKHSLSLSGGDDTLTVQSGCDVTFITSLNLASLTLQQDSSATLAWTEPCGISNFIRTKALSIAEDESGNPTARLDLTTNNLILDYTGNSPLADVAHWVKAGYNAANSGYWDGYGITSSTAAEDASQLTALGVMDNADALLGGKTLFEGETVDATSVLVKYTYWGDANFDGTVTYDDYDIIDYYYWFQPPANQAGWWTGDFDMDTNVDSDDYDLIDYAYWFQGDPLEPGGESLMAGGGDSMMAGESDSVLSDSPASYAYDNPALHDWIRQQLGWEREGVGLPPTRPQDRL